MAVVNFLFGNTTSSGFVLDGAVSFEADLTIDEMHERAATVTEHPVENGSVISDHVIVQPERLLLTGFVTDAGTRDAERGNTQAAFDALDAAADSGQLVQVVTGRKTYENMVLVSADLPRERPESMQFSLEFQQIRLVTPQIVEGILSASQVDPEDANLAQSDVDQGQTRAQRESDEAIAERINQRSSTLSDIFFSNGGDN